MLKKIIPKYKIYMLMLMSLIFSQNSLYASSDSTKTAKQKTPVVIVIPVKGTVDPGMSAFIARALRDAEQYPDRVIILEMDTFGGQVDAAFQIVDTLVNVDDTTIAYVRTKAISAGALIALACNKLYMKNSTTIGDVAPLTYGDNGPQMLGEKFQSPIRAKFRTLAKRNGYPERLTEAMVSQDMTVYEVKYRDSTVYLDSAEFANISPAQKKSIISSKIIDESGELLTMDDVEAHQLGFSKKSVANFSQVLDDLGLENAEVIRMEENWSESFVRIIGTIAPILIMIGFAALYIEIRTPGFGAPGIIGITCLALVFMSQYAAGLADYTELLLMAIGTVLFAIEIFVLPGFGIAGIAGILFLIAGVVLSFQDFVIPDPKFPWQAETLIKNLTMVIGSIIGSVLCIVLFFRFIFPKIGIIVKGPYLQATLRDATSFNQQQIFPHIGDNGTASTSLRPAGKVIIDGETHDVVSEGDYIDKGTPVVVCSINGNHIIVRRKTLQ